MMKTMEALDLLRSEPGIVRNSPFIRPLDASKECAALIKYRDVLRAQIEIVKPTASPLDPAQIWQHFEANRGDLNRLSILEIRTLCLATEFATQPSFVRALLSQPEHLKNGRCLYGMVHSYFARWRQMEAPEKLEALLKRGIAVFPRKSPAIERWRGTHSLFSNKAADVLAELITSRQSSVSDVLNLQYVGGTTRLGVLTRAKTAEIAVKHFRGAERKSDESTNLKFLGWLTRDVLAENLPIGALHHAVSSLILSQSAEKSETFQQVLSSFVQNDPRLGDPRLRQYMPNWRDMEAEAQQRFLSWLAKENILFFFNTILPRNDGNRRRADFWLRYHKQITDFQVAISEQDYWKLKANKSSSQLPLHSTVDHVSTSAFLMKFKGYRDDHVVIEFSETGNATYIYDRPVFESTGASLRTPQFKWNVHLKHGLRRGRILHVGDWEYSARQKLAELGIRQ